MNDFANDLHEALKKFDGKALSLLGEAEAKFGGSTGYLDALIELSVSSVGHVSSGATWLLKHHLEQGGILSDKQINGLIAIHEQLIDWQAKLHFCQFLQFMPLDRPVNAKLVSWLKQHLAHDKPFLRAWSLDGLVRISLNAREFADDAANALKAASEDRAASVRARARNLQKLISIAD